MSMINSASFNHEKESITSLVKYLLKMATIIAEKRTNLDCLCHHFRQAWILIRLSLVIVWKARFTEQSEEVSSLICIHGFQLLLSSADSCLT